MKKILYIGHFIEKPKTGGEICCHNNQLVLKKIFNENFFMYDLGNETKLQIFWNKLFFLYPGLQLGKIKNIYEKIEEIKPNYIFIETAQYGRLVKKIKNKFPNLKIITFFHNIEIQYARSYLSLTNPKSWYFYLLTKINENLSINYSDYRFTINEADSVLMKYFYKKNASAVMSFSVENRITDFDIEKMQSNNKKIFKKNCLFVGSNFFGNTEGLNWFISHILPKVDIHLTIVGNGMSKVFSNTNKITVYDFVDDLSIFYRETDFVVLPIISGGGMKTKTAEAMMWGKAILATDNAFSGYEIKNCEGLYVCNTEEEFISAISRIYEDDIYYFNLNIHQRFSQCHSIESTVKRTTKFLEGIK